MGPKPVILDFTDVVDENGRPKFTSAGKRIAGGRPRTSNTPKAIRARARRKQALIAEDLDKLYKPVEEWDAEELAKGRPRASDGTFKGKPPGYVSRALHEQIVQKFEAVVRLQMNEHTVRALEILGAVLDDERVDDRMRPVVSAATKLDAAKFLIEHILGKPKQRVEQDISVKLQGILATAMVNPDLSQPGQYQLTQGYIDAESREVDEL